MQYIAFENRETMCSFEEYVTYLQNLPYFGYTANLNKIKRIASMKNILTTGQFRAINNQIQ